MKVKMKIMKLQRLKEFMKQFTVYLMKKMMNRLFNMFHLKNNMCILDIPDEGAVKKTLSKLQRKRRVKRKGFNLQRDH